LIQYARLSSRVARKTAKGTMIEEIDRYSIFHHFISDNQNERLSKSFDNAIIVLSLHDIISNINRRCRMFYDIMMHYKQMVRHHIDLPIK
jgi:hypothetical protein